MKLITKEISTRIKKEVIQPAEEKDFETAARNIHSIQQQIHNSIPEDKRGSYGVVHTLRLLSAFITKQLYLCNVNLLNIGTGIYSKYKSDISRAVALGILSEYGKDDFANTSPFFISAALSDSWKLREFAILFYRKLIKSEPEKASELMLETAKTGNPRLRRFVAESLRPVMENSWIKDKPEYALSVLQHMYTEKDEYPRKAVGNALSDLSIHHPKLILDVIKELVRTNNDNAYKIAYRASRHLVENYPVQIMDILGTEEYSYKGKTYSRKAYKNQ